MKIEISNDTSVRITNTTNNQNNDTSIRIITTTNNTKNEKNDASNRNTTTTDKQIVRLVIIQVI